MSPVKQFFNSFIFNGDKHRKEEHIESLWSITICLMNTARSQKREKHDLQHKQTEMKLLNSKNTLELNKK